MGGNLLFMVSLILAVHNGASTLARTLSAFTRLTQPSEGLEIIAVDNASTDDTAGILEAYTSKLPLTVLYEPRQGKSFALNRGIERANGNFIVFTDDDIIPEANWLTAYLEAAKRHPSSVIFAGQVRHEWDAPPPGWLKYLADEGLSYGGTHLDMEEQIVSAGLVKGCNLMVLRSVITQTRFPETPGVNFCGEGRSKGGEDTAFAKEVASQGNGIIFVPSACVRHIVRANQVSLRPVFSRYVRIGGNLPIEATDGIKIFGYPSFGLRRALSQGVKFLFWLVLGRRKEGAVNVVQLAMTIGGLREGRKLSRERNINSKISNRDSQ